MSSRTAKAFCIVFALPLLAASPATSPARRTQIATWLTKLVDRDAAVRDAARIELMSLPLADLPVLRECVIAKRPTPAQACVVRDVVVHLLTREAVRSMPTGGLPYIGVSHAPSDEQVELDPAGELMPSGTTIERVMPGTPAAVLLQVGDAVLGVDAPDGRTLWITPSMELGRPQAPQLGQWIMACPPGDPVTLVVRRAGRVLRVRITPEPRPLPLGPVMDDAVIPINNAKVDANRFFDEQWATLPGLSP